MDVGVVTECLAAAFAGRMTFPETVGRMIETGVERYDVDLARFEATHYGLDGSTHLEPMPDFDRPRVPAGFDADGVRAAIAAIQRGEIDYPEFLRRSMAAGTVGYGVFLAGRKVVYFGRAGDSHVEPFPSR